MVDSEQGRGSQREQESERGSKETTVSRTLGL